MPDAGALMDRAAAARRDDRLEDARRDYAAAVEALRELDVRVLLVRALRGVGQIERDLDRPEAARQPY